MSDFRYLSLDRPEISVTLIEENSWVRFLSSANMCVTRIFIPKTNHKIEFPKHDYKAALPNVRHHLHIALLPPSFLYG